MDTNTFYWESLLIRGDESKLYRWTNTSLTSVSQNAPHDGTNSQISLFVGTLFAVSSRNTRSSSILFIATNDDHKPNVLSPITRMSSFRSMG